MPKDLEMLLKTTYFGTIMMLVRIDTDNIDTADTVGIFIMTVAKQQSRSKTQYRLS